jgi:hypothetical protein
VADSGERPPKALLAAQTQETGQARTISPEEVIPLETKDFKDF